VRNRLNWIEEQYLHTVRAYVFWFGVYFGRYCDHIM